MKMFLLNHQQRVKKWLTDKNFMEASLVEQINAADQLMFSIPLKSRLPPSLYFAVIPRPRHDDYLMFKIISEQVMTDRVQYTCVEAAYDELKSYHYIKDLRPQDRTAANMLQIALEGTRWEVGTVSETGTSSTNFYYISTLEAIQKIVTLFNLEAVFSVSINAFSTKVVRRRVNLYAQQGERTGKRFEYGSNLLTVTREESSEGLVTALIGRGKGEEIYHDADGKKTTASDKEAQTAPDGYGRRINFADVVWSKANGNPVDKPAGQEYVEDPDATALYGFDDGKPRIGIQIFEDITDPKELIQATWKALQVLKRPKVSFKANVIDVGDLGLGDTVAIIRHDIQIEYFTRVYKVTHNLLDEKRNTIELGDDFSGHSMTSTIASMSGAIEKAQQTAGYAAISANGKNTNFYSKDKPAVAVEGDLWYKDLGNGEVDLYQYHDGNWILITSTRDLHNVQKQVDKQIDDMKKYEEANKKRDDEMTQSITEAKNDLDAARMDANNTRDRLNKIAQQAQGNSDGITELSKTVGQIQYTVADNKGNVNQLTQQAGKTELDIKDAVNRLNQLEITAGGLKQTNTDQDGRINQFRVDFNGLKDSVGDNTGKISSLQVDLKGVRSIVSSKADVSYVNQKANEWNVTVKKVKNDISKMSDVQVVNSAIDANNYTTSGHYFVKSTDSSNVPATNWFYFEVTKVDDTRVMQTWQADNDPSKRYSRTYSEGKWSDWHKVANNANPNLLNGTADWSGDWNEIDSDYAQPMNWIQDGRTDPEGNPAITPYSKDLSTDHAPTKKVYLTSGTYTASVWAYITTNTNIAPMMFVPDDINSGAKSDFSHEKVTDLNKWCRVSVTVTVSKPGFFKVSGAIASFNRNELYLGSFKLERGEKATAWVPSANDPHKDTGEYLSMINVDAGNILFKSKKLYLDADSTVFSGKAFIPDAAITQISADKITTGTLNAGLINVINVNANSITTGTIQGTNLSINLNSGEVLFQHGRITSTSGTLNIDIDKGTMSVTNWSNDGFYFQDGRMDLSDSWPSFDSFKYGSVQLGDGNNMNFEGMALIGSKGLVLKTKDYNGGLFSMATASAGASIDLNSGDGFNTFQAAGRIVIAGGNEYSTGYFNQQPQIEIGYPNPGSATVDRRGSRISIDAEYVHIPAAYRQTASSGSWLMVAPDGALIRSTSASKYKTDIKRSYVFDYGEKLLELPTATWMDKADMRRYSEGESEIKPKRNFGMIAEDLADAGLEMLVTRNPEGGLEGIQYDRIGPALIPVIKNLKDRIEKLEAKLNE